MKNLDELLISISDFKTHLSEIIKDKQTRVIVKNNRPVSVIMPYGEYIRESIISDTENGMENGREMLLSNGVKVKVVVSLDAENGKVVTKVWAKSRYSSGYKLNHAFHLGYPSVESTLHPQDIGGYYEDICGRGK